MLNSLFLYSGTYPSLPYLEFKHLIRKGTVPIPHLARCFYPSNRYTIFESSTRTSRVAGYGVRVGQILWHQTKLSKSSSLIPCNMFIVQSITADIHHGSEWDLCSLKSGRDARQATVHYLVEEVCQQGSAAVTYSQSISRS